MKKNKVMCEKFTPMKCERRISPKRQNCKVTGKAVKGKNSSDNRKNKLTPMPSERKTISNTKTGK